MNNTKQLANVLKTIERCYHAEIHVFKSGLYYNEPMCSLKLLMCFPNMKLLLEEIDIVIIYVSI